MKIEQSRYFPFDHDDTPELWTVEVTWNPQATELIVHVTPPWERVPAIEVPIPNDIATLEVMQDRLDLIITNVAENRKPYFS